MKDKNMNKPTVILHGEAMIFTSNLPDDAVQIEPTNGDFHIIADSETTGNHHVIDIKRGTRFFKSGDRSFVAVEEPTQVRCVHPARHDAVTLTPGVYETSLQQEYDHFEQNLRNVRD
jgi:hypothetical protein